MRARWLAVVVLAGCAKVDAFVCEGDQECVDGGKAGACEKSGFCSFPDAGCPTGKRYGEYASESLAGTCVELVECVGGCGPCGTCVDGGCVQKQAGEACELQCEEYVFGLSEGAEQRSCVAFAGGVGAGTCDEAGACAYKDGACTQPGMEFVGCDEACGRDDHNCTPGTPVEAVTAATLCTTGASTELCRGTCTDVMGQASLVMPKACDAGGLCVEGPPAECGGYTCAPTFDACGTTCEKQVDCAAGFMCSMTGACE